MTLISILVGLGVGSTGGGCSQQPKSRLESQATRNITISEDQLRVRVRSLVGPVCGRLQRQADAVIAASPDRSVQLAALSWQIEAVPALREALYQPDPITAAIDAVALCMQMADYFQTGPGRQSMGPASAQCAATCQEMADDLMKALGTATKSGEVPKLRKFAQQWAADHPIRGSIAERESTVARMSDFLADQGLFTGDKITEAATTMDDMNRKLDVYSDQLLRQLRWEVDRLKLQVIAELHLDQAVPMAERVVNSTDQMAKAADRGVGAVDRLSPAIERSLKVAEDASTLIASQRELALAAVHEEVTRAMQFAREERHAALAGLNTAMVEQRKLVASEAEQIAEKEIDYALRQVVRLVAVAVAAVLVMAMLGIFVLRRLPLRRTSYRLHRRVVSDH